MYFEIALIVALGIASIIDLKTKKIPVQLVVGMLIAGVFRTMLLVYETDNIKGLIFNIILSMIPGLFMLLISFLSKQSIGYGDSLIVLAMSFFLSAEELIGIIMFSMTMAGIVALILIVVAKKKKNYEMAFCPFLILGYGAMVLLRF